MSGGSLDNFWLRMQHFGDSVRSKLAGRDIDQATAEAIERIVSRVEALSSEVKAIEYFLDGDIVSADLVRLEGRYGGREQ